ncbi:hypothetical protein FRC10_004702, partial [Ceratobasidium sp. 414]
MPETIQAASGARGHTRRRGPIGLAKKYEMKEVNPAFIAYVACVTRQALTTSKNFSEVCDRFSYTKFYYTIRNVLESPKYEHWTKGLIEHWNEKLFSGYEFGLNPVVSGVRELTPNFSRGSVFSPPALGHVCLLGFSDYDSVYTLASAVQNDSDVRASRADAQPLPFTL